MLLLASTVPGPSARAITPAPTELEQARAWADRTFGEEPDAANPAPHGVAFTTPGTTDTTSMRDWPRELRTPPDDGTARTQRELRLRDPATGLEVRIEAELFHDGPAVEWVAHLRNTGTNRTPVLEGIQAFQGVLPLPRNGPATLHWATGGVASFDDFAPQETALKPGNPVRLQPGGGRSSSGVLPYFNVAGPDGGVVVAVGWTGEWAAEFGVHPAGQVTLRAGMARTRLYLEPGESIRTPRMLFLFYQGDRWRGQNLLRRHILAHHRPRVGGRPLVSPITCGNWGATPASVHLDNIARIVRHRLPIEYYWIDAEWYGQGGWPSNVGNWNFKRDLYPAGFKPLSDALRAHGRHLMLWFEPERVVRGTAWHKEHPQWLLGPRGDNFLMNLGNPEARKFVTDFIGDRIEEFGLGCYRQDFNFEPLPYWKAADAPDREGISEIRYIEGLYAFWDGLRERHPGLLIDNCASGGRRLDLEATGRATPFWRTDGPRDPVAHQCHTHGLLAWLPLSATSQDEPGNDYEFRSSMCSSLCLNWWVRGDVPAGPIRDDFPFDWARSTLEQYLTYRDAYEGDYYPLTRYSQARDVWMAYQLDRPDQGRGLVVILRRPDSPYRTARFPLQGLVPSARYRLTDLDSGRVAEKTGRELLEGGLEATLDTRPGSALVTYQRE